MVFNIEHLMSFDPRRRFIMGLTIEDTTARLWHADRSGKIVAKPFNFIVRVMKLEIMISSLTYSNTRNTPNISFIYSQPCI